MGCEAEQKSIPRLPLFSIPVPAIEMQMQSPERPGMLTPPLQTSASVPFHWEQEPGKPRLCNALVTFSNPTDNNKCCLELPPRLLVASPTTLFQGPYVANNKFKSPSFRMGNRNNRYSCYGSSSGSDKGLLGAMVLIKGESGWFGSWRKKVKREVTGGSYVFPSSTDNRESGGSSIADTCNNKMTKRSGSSSTISHGKSRVWRRIREGMKQVVSWRSKKLKKDGSGFRF